MENSATNSQSGSTNRILNDIPQRDLDGGGISIKCLRKIFKVSTNSLNIISSLSLFEIGENIFKPPKTKCDHGYDPINN